MCRIMSGKITEQIFHLSLSRRPKYDSEIQFSYYVGSLKYSMNLSFPLRSIILFSLLILAPSVGVHRPISRLRAFHVERHTFAFKQNKGKQEGQERCQKTGRGHVHSLKQFKRWDCKRVNGRAQTEVRNRGRDAPWLTWEAGFHVTRVGTQTGCSWGERRWRCGTGGHQPGRPSPIEAGWREGGWGSEREDYRSLLN